MSLQQFAFSQKYLYVSTKGTGSSAGTLEDPFGSIQQAAAYISGNDLSKNSDVVVYVMDGLYRVGEPIVFDESNSGMNGHKITYKAYKNANPVISGGIKVTKWMSAGSNIYKAKVKRNTKLRSFYVNGVRARMAGAKSVNKGCGCYGKYIIRGTEKWAEGAGETYAGIKILCKGMPHLSNPENIEITQTNIWTEKIACVKDIKYSGDTCIFLLQQPYGAILASLGWAAKLDCNKYFYIRNAQELLDEPGEFYFDKKNNELYYYSRGEDMKTADAEIPMSEGLIKIYGKSTSQRVENINFEGLTFSYDDWNLMKVENSYGLGGVQSIAMAEKYVPDGNWHKTRYNSTNIPYGTIDMKNCSDIVFIRNRFEHLGTASAISMVNDVVDCFVKGNYFNDLSGNAMTIGHPQHYEIGDGEIYGKGVEGVCADIDIENNYIRNVCLDFRQFEGISSFYVREVKIEHNDLSNVPYCGISCGWGSGNSGLKPSEVGYANSISFNRIGNTNGALHYGGSIYILGEQPHSRITGNYIYRHDKEITGLLCIDDGSAYWNIFKNVLKNGNRLWLYIWSSASHDMNMNNNYVENNLMQNNGTNVNVYGTVNNFRKELSPEALKIKASAGIEDKYKYIIPAKEPKVISLYPDITEYK